MISLKKILFLFSLILFLSALLLPSPLAAQTPAESMSGSQGGNAWIIPIRGEIGPFMANFIRKEARRALAEGAEYLVFEIDTFGGRVDSTLQITSFIMSIRGARTIAWINSSDESTGVSWSAGAIIAFACEDIFMAPGTSMGAAAPVIASPGGAEAADEKNVAAIRSQVAALAERNNHPVSLALAMVDIDIELWEVSVDGETRALTLPELERLERESRGGRPLVERLGIISEKGKLLSLSAGEALRYGLIRELVMDRESLREVTGISGQIIETAPSNADFIISFLTSGAVQTILILLGLVMLYFEIQSPGFGIPGVIGILAFIIVFGSGFLLGRVDSLEIIFFLIGVGLLVIEIFILPGFGIIGVSGIILIGLSLIFSMQDFVIPRFDWEWELFGRNALVVFTSLLGAVFGIAILALFGPKIILFDRLMLKTAITGTAGGPDPELPVEKIVISGSGDFSEDDENYASLLGKRGLADSVLRPSGRALIEGRTYTVDADNEFVDPGTDIIVTRVRGNRIIVRKV